MTPTWIGVIGILLSPSSLAEFPALQSQLAAEALELADPVEELENPRHQYRRQREAEPSVVPMFEVGVKIVP